MLSDLEKEAICLKLTEVLTGSFMFDEYSIHQDDFHWFLFGPNDELILTDKWNGLAVRLDPFLEWAESMELAFRRMEPESVCYEYGDFLRKKRIEGASNVVVKTPGGPLAIVSDDGFIYVYEGKIYKTTFEEMMQ